VRSAARHRPLRAAPLVLALALLAWAALAAQASANRPPTPRYSISIVAGETTQPEADPVAVTDASVTPATEAVLSIVHNGLVVWRATDRSGSPSLWGKVPQAGDVVTLEAPSGSVVAAVVYDGLPSIAPTVCAGSANFSGQRSGADPVEGGYYSLALVSDPYGNTSVQHRGVGQAQVTTLVGSGYAGGFLTPLALGQTVWASESFETQLTNGAVFTYQSENVEPVGSCPVTPAPPPPPPPPPALQGSIFRLGHVTIRRLLRSGLHSTVAINQPGTVIQDLYLQDGRIPAHASSRKRSKHHHKPPALLLARGSATATGAGNVSVLLRVTAAGRRALRHRKHVHAELLTTLRSNGGASLSLGARTIALSR
jgi:hypothetical protein